MKLSTTISTEEKYDSPVNNVVVAPAGWCTCTCTCCWCHCHISNAQTFEEEDEEL
jgi:hypothetical protein